VYNRASPRHDGVPVRLKIRRPFKALIFKNFRLSKTGENIWRAPAQIADNFRRNYFRLWKTEIISSISTVIIVTSKGPLQAGYPGRWPVR